MGTRRQFLKGFGAALAALLFSLGKIWQSKGRTLAGVPEQEAGELYAGFLLLPEDALVPPIVKHPEPGSIPIMEGLPGGPAATAIARDLPSPSALTQEVQIPMYTFKQIPDTIRLGKAHLVRHVSGKTFMASVNFEAFDPQLGVWESAVNIVAQASFPSPFPIWSTRKFDGELIAPEKVSFLPTPGVSVRTARGFLFHWIESGVLYTLRAENHPSRTEAQALARSLAVVAS